MGRNQHQPSRGIETVLVFSPVHHGIVEININPVEGLKLEDRLNDAFLNLVEININPVEGLKLALVVALPAALGRRNQHQPSRGIETRIGSPLARSQRHVEININPVEGLKHGIRHAPYRLAMSKSTSTQSRD